MKTFKQILNEWPYTEHNDKIFDFELEKIKTNENLFTFLKYLTSGIDIHDKYGNKFTTKTSSGKEKFKNRLIQDEVFITDVISSFNITKDKLIKFIKTL